VNIPAANRSTRVPQEVLTDSVLEEIKTRCCFVGEALGPSDNLQGNPAIGDESSEMDLPPSDATQSESEFSHAGLESNVSSSHRESSEFSIISNPRGSAAHNPSGENHLQALATLYTRNSTATELRMRVVPPASQQTGTGLGTLIIPGWIRERSAEVLFEGGDVDESSTAEVILDSLLKVPVDLRKTLASSILIAGGTSMLPGFIPRLHAELLRAIAPPPPPSRQPIRPDKPLPPQYDRYAVLRPLTPFFAILNNPSPPPTTSERAGANAGKAPAFSPATMAWVGGSLAGALKTGGVEVAREKWDEIADSQRDPDSSMDVDSSGDNAAADQSVRSSILPDWTRSPLPVGAPPAPRLAAPSPQVPVGA